MTADQCLEHPWLKQYPEETEVIVTQIPSECKTDDSIKSPLIEVEVHSTQNLIHVS